MARILFYCVHDTISLAMFEDLADALIKDGHDVSFEFVELIAKDSAECLEIAAQRGYKVVDSKADGFDIAFGADFRGIPHGRAKVTIDLGHGHGSKASYYYTDTEYASTYFFAQSPLIAHRINTCQDKTIAVVAGVPKLDRAYQDKSDGRTILVAPTFNREYNCLNMIKDQLPELAEKYRVIIKPHRYFLTSPNPDVVEWREWLERHEGKFELRYDYNIVPLIRESSLMISDMSSAYMEFMSVNKPVIFCESDFMRQEKLEKLYRGAHEYIFQYGCDAIIKDGEELPLWVDEILEGEKQLSLRRYECSQVLNSYQGNSIDRCLELVNLILKGEQLKPAFREEVS